MPIVQADRLTRIGTALLTAAGASGGEAGAVANCVNANLAGHDSPGVILIDLYLTASRPAISCPARNGPSCRDRRPRP